jgi:flagellar hook-length control protein FliK
MIKIVELVVQDNQVTAKINTENAAVKEVILANLDQLKSNLINAGTQINKFDVEVGGFKNYFEQHFSKGVSGNAHQQ